jgi:hypothetical protein
MVKTSCFILIRRSTQDNHNPMLMEETAVLQYRRIKIIRTVILLIKILNYPPMEVCVQYLITRLRASLIECLSIIVQLIVCTMPMAKLIWHNHKAL